MENWYQEIREASQNILEKIYHHPFVMELMAGTLSQEVFVHYIRQDAYYLSIYKKVLAEIGIRCHETADTDFFLQSATGIIAVEHELHQYFLSSAKGDFCVSPTTELYTSYLSRMVHTESLEVALAAVLPCFTVYKDVGDYILKHQSNSTNNPYQSWIQTYGGEDFALAVEKAVTIAEKYAQKTDAETLQRMSEAYITAAKMEWMFWDSAYHKETWKI